MVAVLQMVNKNAGQDFTEQASNSDITVAFWGVPHVKGPPRKGVPLCRSHIYGDPRVNRDSHV